MGQDSLADRFQDSFRFEQNKPDFKEFDLGSPSLTTPSTATIPSHTISPKRSNINTSTTHSGELEKLRSIATARSSKHGHQRSSSTGASLIYSGSTPSYCHSINSSSTSTSNSSTITGSGGGGGGVNSNTISSVSSRNSSNLYPSGNICPTGKILKSNMGFCTSNRT